MPATSTIDQHAVNRARLVERLAKAALALDCTADQVPDEGVRRSLLRFIGEDERRALSATTWALLMIRLGGEI